jgi:hypothetical protein
MGVIIKYQLSFPDANLKVSNDFFSGDFIIDADISVEMRRGQAGCSFELKLYDLPLAKAKKIETLSSVIIKLGYFDGTFDTVAEGIIEKVTRKVDGDKLVTGIKGLESGTYALKNTTITIPGKKNISLKDNSIEQAVTNLLEAAKIEKGKISKTPKIQNITDSLKGAKTFNKTKLIQAIDQLAEVVQAEFFVCDRQVFLGKPIKNDSKNGSYEPPKFEENVNLAKYEPIAKKVPKKEAEDRAELSELLPAVVAAIADTGKPSAEGFDFIIAGDPKLRPGQKVVAKVDESLAEIGGVSNNEFWILELTHKFTLSEGYVCNGRAITACNDGQCRKREIALIQPNSERFVEEFRKKNAEERRSNPSIEVGDVKQYTPKQHLTTLFLGQNFQEAESQPSINIEVDKTAQLIFEDKPIAVPFAWHKCGLMTPIYPGMKALINHNLNLQDDGIITGFIWSKMPEISPPQNKEGDWWLCLPIDFDSSNPPSDNTKAVNDLTANNGKRVIEVKGLKITIGNERLRNVGIRPEEGGNDEFLIEHKSGTKIKIGSDGKLEIEAEKILIKGNVEIEGNLAIK